MRMLALGTALAGAWLVVDSPGDIASSPSRPEALPISVTTASVITAGPAVSAATLTAVVQQYCVVCHNDQLLTGNISFQGFEVESAAARAETAERMIRKLRAGMMPPPGMPRPAGDTLRLLVETLESEVDAAARAAPRLGERRFPRLSQAEYERLIFDLLALEVDAENWLPPDIFMGSFDNQSAAQPFSTTLLDSFLRAATEVSRLAVGNPNAPSTTVKYENPYRMSQHAWERVEGAPFGTRGGTVITHDFPADGEYVFQVETDLGKGNQVEVEDLDISIDGEQVALLMLEENGGKAVSDILTEPIFVRAGQRKVSAAFVNFIEGPYDDLLTPMGLSSTGAAVANYGATGLTHLTTLSVMGPSNVVGVSETESRRRIFTCRPTSAAQERSCAESILKNLSTKAYRRPVPDDRIADLMGLYDKGAAQGGFEVGVRTGLQAILVSPYFLFRLEQEPADVLPGQVYRLSDAELATRLSFFLWDAAPDQQLLDLVASGRMSNRGVLEDQVQRMLQDPRSEALATRFAHQWLRLQDVGKVWPVPFYFPDFSAQLAEALVRETELFFQHLVQEDKSLLEFFDADYTFVNERLAKHYEIEGVYGEEFRRVQYPNEQRRGIFGHGSVLQLTSVSGRTSPVLRGKWVMEVLLGTPPPPPPPNVPAFESTPDVAQGGRRLTTRERMEAHAKNPVCNSCHRFIDPIGLALDNFDVTGRWRFRENMAPLDTRGVLYDGTPVSSPGDLADAFLKRPVPLVRNFTERLLSYAIGRPLESYDQPTIRAITRAAESDGYKVSSLILGVVNSDLFQMRQAQSTAN